MPKYRVSEFADYYRAANPDLSTLDDSAVIELISKEQPDLLGKVDREDLTTIMRLNRDKQTTRERQKTFSSLSGYDRFAAGTGQSMMDIFQGIKQMFGGNTDAYKADKELYMEASKGNKMAGAGEIFGAVAATSPTMLIPGVGGTGLASKIAGSGIVKSMAAGAGYGLTEHVDEGESRLKNTLVGAGLGAGGYGVAKGVGAGLGATKKLGIKTFNALRGKYPNASVKELEKLAEKEGIKLSAGDLTGKSSIRKSEVAAESKVGGLSGFREQQATDANRIMTGLVEGMKPKAGTNVGKQLLESTLKAKDLAKAQAKKNYNKVEELSGGAKIVPSNSIKKLGKVEKSFKGDVPEETSTVEWFRQLNENLADGKKSYSSLRQTRESLGKQAKKYAVSDPNRQRLILEVRNEVEKDMDEVINAQVEKMAQMKKTSIIKKGETDAYFPHDPKVQKDIKKNVRKGVKEETKKWEERGEQLKSAYEIAKKQYREDVVPYKTSTSLKAILKGEEPDQIYKKMIQEGHDDKAKIFYKALDNDGRETVAYGIVKTALDKAKTNTPQGTNYSPAKFSTYLDDMQAHSKLFMTTEQKAKADGVEKLMKAAVRAGQYAENPPTGNRAEIAKELRNAKLTLGIVPLITQMEKFFWTGKGKKFLIAASELEPGSEKMAKLIEKMKIALPSSGKATAITADKLQE